MATSEWLKTIKEAKKTTLIQDDAWFIYSECSVYCVFLSFFYLFYQETVNFKGRTKVHYSFSNENEMTEQYDNNSGIIIERKWKRVPMLGGEGTWTYEIGQEPEKPGSDIRESATNPIFCRIDTKQAFQWRIRNLPYPIDTYQLSIEDNDSVIVLRTTNKKYFKRINIPDLERLGAKLDSSLLSKKYANNTLVISYTKPEAYLAFEKELKAELAKTKPISGGDLPCASM